MDQFFDEMRHNNERAAQVCRVCYRQGCQGQCQVNISARWADSHIAAETEADRQFIASAKLLAALPKKQKRFSWAGVIGFLVVAAGVMWLAYSFVEGF